ncbi:MAG: PAS domain S-box protein [Candidatus Omnitrophota bacterium]
MTDKLLRESGERLNSIFDSMQTGIIIIDAGTHIIVDANNAAVRMIGTQRQDIIGHTCFKFICPMEAGCCPIIELGEYLEKSECVLLRADGSRVPVFKSASAITLDNHKYIIEGLVDISERKWMEELLIESEEKYRVIFENTGAATIIVDEDRIIYMANREFVRISGYEREEIEGKKNWTEFVHSEDVEKMRCYHSDRRSGKQERSVPDKYEFRFLDRNGMVHNCLVTVAMIQGTKKSVASIVDITEHKKTAEIIHEKEERFRNMIANVPGVIFRCSFNADRTMEFVSNAVEDISGYKPEDLMCGGSRAYTGIIHQDDRRKVGEVIGAAVARRTQYAVEYRIFHAGGGQRWVLEKGQGVFSSEGAPVFLDGSIFDITERIQKEDEIRHVYRMMRSILEKAPMGIYTVNAAGNIDYVNLSMLMISGVSREEFMGYNVYELPPYKRIGLDEKIRRAFEGESFFLGGVEYHGHKSEKNTIRNFTGMPLEEGHEKKILVFVEDITERSRVEKLKDEFLNTVSHELRTPLAITREGLSLIIDRIAGDLNDKQAHILSVAKDNIDRLGRIINGLLDISKIDSGKVELRKSLVDMNALIRQVAVSFENRVKQKGLELRLELPPEEISIYADSDKVIQIFINLVGNALKFTEKGYIGISLQHSLGEIICSVSDSGAGISEENIPKLFSKFQQFGRKAGGGEKGTGLGLSIVKSLVELHKGAIRVESGLGAGSSFIFTLPSFNSEELFREYITNGIKDARSRDTRVSLIMISVLDFEGVRQRIPQERLHAALRGMERLLEESLRRAGDVAVKDTCEIIVLLSDCSRESAAAVSGRLKETVTDYLREEGLDKEIKINFGIATYPAEAGNDEELISKARNK